MKTDKQPQKIPQFANYQEEAEFWETHKVTDYPYKLVRGRIVPKLSDGITIRLESQALQKLRAAAGAQGIGPTTLARMWILERLRGDIRAS